MTYPTCMIRYYSFLVFFFSVSVSFAQQGSSRPVNILFVGNSYTYFNNLPQICSGMAASTGDVLIAEQATVGGYRFKQHLADSNSVNKIKNGPVYYVDRKVRKSWDYVVLQEHSVLPSNKIAEVKKEVFSYARSLDSLVHLYNPSAKTIFYRTWGRKNGDKAKCLGNDLGCSYIGMDNLLAERYQLMAEMNKAILSPVGEVWKVIREKYPDIELYNQDESHPSEAGSYAAAACFYTIVFKKDPELIKFNYTLDPEVAGKIRGVVREVAYMKLQKWYSNANPVN